MVRIAKAWGMTAAHHDELAERVRRDGHCIIPGLFPRSLITEWHHHFYHLLRNHIEREGQRQNRGSFRYYVTLPFTPPFADPFVFADPDILAVVDRLVGPDTVMCQLATDTPVVGSDYQELHRDAPPLFPEWGRETPPFQLAVNFPLVDVTEQNGPLETTCGTHALPKEEALEKIRRGEIPIERITMQAGDVMIRDVRAIHRGTPNRSSEPRPMVVLGYSRRWLFRPEVSIRIPRSMWENLSDEHRHLLRFNRVVDQLEQESDEIYQNFAY
jgi:hypothetical protein